jgi:hypothetical protein
MGQCSGQNLERVLLLERRVSAYCDINASLLESHCRVYHCRFLIPAACYTNIGAG